MATTEINELDQAISYHMNGDINRAEAGYRELMSRNLKVPVIYLNLASICLKTGRIEEAKQLLQIVLDLNPACAEAFLNLGIAEGAVGNLNRAIACYEKAIELNPSYAEAHNNIGNVFKIQGKLDRATSFFSKAVESKPEYFEGLYNLADVLHRQGLFEAAVASYRKAMALNPRHAVVHNDLGVALWKLGRLDEAISLFRKALELKPDYPEVYLNLGAVLKGLQQYEEAITACRKAIELRPGYVEAYNNLGTALQEAGRLEESIATLKKAIELSPEYAQAHYNLAVSLQRLGRLDECIDSYRHALSLNPDHPQTYLNLGVALSGSFHSGDANAKLNEAISLYRKAIELKPDFAPAYQNIGIAFQEQQKLDDALTNLRKAVEIDPNYADAYRNIGLVLRERHDVNGSISAHRKALELQITRLASTSCVREVGDLLLEMDRLPVIYKSVEEIDECRDHFISCLREGSHLMTCHESEVTKAELSILQEILFGITNFYLVYQQLNDSGLQAEYCELAKKILQPSINQYFQLEERPRSSKKIRLGVASQYLKQHNGSYWAFGWLSNLPKTDYEMFFYSLNGATDTVTQKFAALGTYRWLPFRTNSYRGSLKLIKDDNLDVLLLPDVGMTASSRILSMLRLAPVQCVGWGHPVTTGSPNMDFYLSGELMESEESDEYYSEKLVRLPNTGLHLDPPGQPQNLLSRSDFDIPENKIVYGAVQSLFKYLPQFDLIYPAIASKVPDALFIFVEHPSDHVTSTLQERLKKAFREQGLSYEKHVKFLERMPFDRFMRLLKVLDFSLDSIGFNGGTTAMRALAMDLPVIALKGKTLIGRAGYSMLKMAGLDELIADSLDEYISIAARFGLDKELRDSTIVRIKLRKQKLFNDMQCVKALDDFFKQEVERAGRNPA